jgi:hypothetical protein
VKGTKTFDPPAFLAKSPKEAKRPDRTEAGTPEKNHWELAAILDRREPEAIRLKKSAEAPRAENYRWTVPPAKRRCPASPAKFPKKAKKPYPASPAQQGSAMNHPAFPAKSPKGANLSPAFPEALTPEHYSYQEARPPSCPLPAKSPKEAKPAGYYPSPAKPKSPSKELAAKPPFDPAAPRHRPWAKPANHYPYPEARKNP